MRILRKRPILRLLVASFLLTVVGATAARASVFSDFLAQISGEPFTIDEGYTYGCADVYLTVYDLIDGVRQDVWDYSPVTVSLSGPNGSYTSVGTGMVGFGTVNPGTYNVSVGGFDWTSGNAWSVQNGGGSVTVAKDDCMTSTSTSFEILRTVGVSGPSTPPPAPGCIAFTQSYVYPPVSSIPQDCVPAVGCPSPVVLKFDTADRAADAQKKFPSVSAGIHQISPPMTQTPGWPVQGLQNLGNSPIPLPFINVPSGNTCANVRVTYLKLSPMLSLFNAVDSTTAAPGGYVTYTVRMYNNGNAPTKNPVSISIPMSTYLDGTTAELLYASSSVTFTKGSQVTIASVSPLPVSQTPLVVSYRVKVKTTAAPGNVITNFAYGETLQAQSGNTTVQLPHLEPYLGAAPETVVPGQDISYSFSVQNLSTAPAFNRTVTIPITSGMTFQGFESGYSANTAYNSTTKVITLTLPAGGLAAGSITPEVRFTLRAPSAGTYTVTATATNGASPSATASAVTNVQKLPIINVTKSVLPATFRADQEADYTIVVKNTGGPTTLSLSDDIPAPLKIRSVNQPGWQQFNNNVTWYSESFAAGTPAAPVTKTYVIKVGIDQGDRGFSSNLTLNNQAIATSVTNPPLWTTPAKSAIVPITVTPLPPATVRIISPQLTITTIDGASVVTAPTNIPQSTLIDYKVVIENTVPSSFPATVRLRTTFPPNFLKSISIVNAYTATGTPAGTGVADAAAGTIDWNITVTNAAPVTLRMRGTENSRPQGTTAVFSTEWVSGAPIASGNLSNVPSPPLTVTIPPSLFINKTVKPPEPKSYVLPYETVEYSIYVSNAAGVATAVNVPVEDLLDPNLTFKDIANSDPGVTGDIQPVGTCTGDSASNPCVRWVIPSIPAGATKKVVVNATVKASAPHGTVIRNRATVRPVGGVAKTTADTVSTVKRLPILTITKEAPAGGVLKPGPNMYTIRIRNAAGGGPVQMSVTDTLPPELLLPSNPAQKTYTWPVVNIAGDMNTFTEVSFPITVNLAPGVTNGAKIKNSVSLTATPEAGPPITLTTSVDADVELPPDLEITKSLANPALKPKPGDIVEYDIGVRALSTGGPAQNVIVTDLLSSNLQYVDADGNSIDGAAATGADCATDGSSTCTIQWNIGNLVPGAPAPVSLKLRARVRSIVQHDTVITNTARATPSNPSTAFKEATASVTVKVPPQLSVSKTASSTKPKPGDTVEYTINVAALGTGGPASSVIVTDLLSADLEYVDAFYPPNNGAPDTGSSCIPGSSTCTIKWTIPSLGAGAPAITLKLRAKVRDVQNGTKIENTVTAAAGGTTATSLTLPANTLTVTRPPVLNIEKTVDKTFAHPDDVNEELVYTIVVSNESQSTAGPAQNMVVTDTLDLTKLTFISATGSPSLTASNCTAGNSCVLTWNVSSFAAPQTSSFTVRAKAKTSVAHNTLISNTASVSADNFNPKVSDPAADVRVSRPSKLSITKAPVAPTTVFTGDPVTYTITVANDPLFGPLTAPLAVTDFLDLTKVAFISASGTPITSPPNCASGTACTVQWTIPQNAFDTVGAPPVMFTIRVRSPLTPGSLTNTAQLQGLPTITSTPAVTVNARLPQLEITKTVDRDKAYPDASSDPPITYTIKVKNGSPTVSGPANNVTITDTVDLSKLTNVTVSGTPESPISACTPNVPCLMTWKFPVIKTDEEVTITVQGKAKPVRHDTEIRNSVTVVATNFPSFTTANTSTFVKRDFNPSIIKTTIPPANVLAGATVTYNIVVSNDPSAGPATQDLVITDKIDPGLTYMNTTLSDFPGAMVPGSNCQAGSTTCLIAWTIPSARFSTVGAAPVTLKVQVRAPNPGTFLNSASITDGPVSADASVTVGSQPPSLSVIQVPSATSVEVGTSMSFDITVTNAVGAGPVTNEELTSTLAGFVYVPTGTTPAPTGTTPALRWPIGPLTGGQSKTFHVNVTAPAIPGPYSNTASVTGATSAGPVTTTVTVTPKAPKLSVTKVPSVTSVEAGKPMSFDITVKNDATGGAATSGQISDTLSGFVYVPAGTTPVPAVSGNTLTWTYATAADPLDPGEEITFHVNVTAPATPNAYTNTATITGVTPGSATVTVLPRASVSLALSPVKVNGTVLAGNTLSRGDALEYTLTVANATGTSPATFSVADVFTVPANTLEDIRLDGAPVAGTTVNIPSSAYNAGDTRQFVISAKVRMDAVHGATVKNAASAVVNALTISATTPDLTVHVPGELSLGTPAVTLNGAALTPPASGTATADVKRGDTFVYDVPVTNTKAGSAATSTTIETTFPVGFFSTITNISPGGVQSQTASTVTIRWNVAVTNPTPVPLRFTGTVNPGSLPDANAVIHTTYPTGGPGTQPTPTYAQDWSLTVKVPPSVSLSKTVFKGSAAATQGSPNETLTYTLTVTNATNAGALPAGLIVEDVFSPYLTVTAPAGATVDAVNRKITWPVLAMGIGESKSLTYTATVTPPQNTTNGFFITNTARMTNPPLGTPAGGIMAIRSIPLVMPPQYNLEKAVSKTEAKHNDPLVYTIKVSNTVSGSIGQNVVIEDVLPDHVAFASAPGMYPGTLDTSGPKPLVRWTIPSLPYGSAIDLPLVVTVRPTAPDTFMIRNSAREVSTDKKSNDVDTQVKLPVSVSIAKVAKRNGVVVSEIKPGENLRYELTVSNASGGGSVPAGLNIEDNFSSHVTNVALVGNPPGVNLDAFNRKITWTLPNALGAGQSVTIAYTADPTMANSAVEGTIIQNNARITNPPTGTPPNQVTASANITLRVDPEYSLSKTVTLSEVKPGQSLAYTIVVTNTAPGSIGQNVIIEDELPEHVTFGNALSGNIGWQILPATATQRPRVRWTIPSLPYGSAFARTLSLVVTVNQNAPAGFNIRNTAWEISTNEPSDTAETDVTIPASVSISKVATKDGNPISEIKPGETVQYAVTVKNGAAAGVLPAGLNIEDTYSQHLANVRLVGTPPGAIIDAAARKITWTLPNSLAADESATLLYRAEPVTGNGAGEGTVITNTARMTNPPVDTPVDQTTVTENVTLHITPAFEVSKTVSLAKVEPTQGIVYTIVVKNTVPGSIAKNVEIEDELPAQYVSFVTGFSGPISGQVVAGSNPKRVKWVIPELKYGTGNERTLTLGVSVDADAPDKLEIKNKAREVSTGAESSEVLTTVEVPASLALTKTVAIRNVADELVPVTEALPGAILRYELRVTNNGGALETPRTIEDTLSPHVTFLGFEGEPPATEANGVIRWTPPLAAGEAKSLFYTVTVTPAANVPHGTAITNSARILAANTSSAPSAAINRTVTLIRSSDLKIKKEAFRLFMIGNNQATIPVTPASPAVPGERLLFRVTVQNSGAGPSQPVSVIDGMEDPLLQSPEIGSVNPDVSNAIITSDGMVQWSIPAIPASQSHVLEYEAVVSPLAPTVQITNTAEIMQPATGIKAVANIPIVRPAPPQPNVALIKELRMIRRPDGQGNFAQMPLTTLLRAGDIARFGLIARNTGQGPATGVVVEDISNPLQLQQFTVITTASSAGATPEFVMTQTSNENRGVWNVPPIPPNQERSMTYDATVQAPANPANNQAPAPLQNAARVILPNPLQRVVINVPFEIPFVPVATGCINFVLSAKSPQGQSLPPPMVSYTIKLPNGVETVLPPFGGAVPITTRSGLVPANYTITRTVTPAPAGLTWTLTGAPAQAVNVGPNLPCTTFSEEYVLSPTGGGPAIISTVTPAPPITGAVTPPPTISSISGTATSSPAFGAVVPPPVASSSKSSVAVATTGCIEVIRKPAVLDKDGKIQFLMAVPAQYPLPPVQFALDAGKPTESSISLNDDKGIPEVTGVSPALHTVSELPLTSSADSPWVTEKTSLNIQVAAGGACAKAEFHYIFKPKTPSSSNSSKTNSASSGLSVAPGPGCIEIVRRAENAAGTEVIVKPLDLPAVKHFLDSTVVQPEFVLDPVSFKGRIVITGVTPGKHMLEEIRLATAVQSPWYLIFQPGAFTVQPGTTCSKITFRYRVAPAPSSISSSSSSGASSSISSSSSSMSSSVSSSASSSHSSSSSVKSVLPNLWCSRKLVKQSLINGNLCPDYIPGTPGQDPNFGTVFFRPEYTPETCGTACLKIMDMGECCTYNGCEDVTWQTCPRGSFFYPYDDSGSSASGGLTTCERKFQQSQKIKAYPCLVP